MGSILESGRSPGGGHGNPPQFSCLENPMDRRDWQAIAYRVAKRRTWLKQHIRGSLDFPKACPYKEYNKVYISSKWVTSIWTYTSIKIHLLRWWEKNWEFLQCIIHNIQFTTHYCRERELWKEKNAVGRGQHWDGSDFGFRKKRKYYKYIQITKGTCLRILKRYSLQGKKRDKILHRKLEL